MRRICYLLLPCGLLLLQFSLLATQRTKRNVPLQAKRIKLITREFFLGDVVPEFEVSPDLRHVAYVVKRNGSAFITVDGVSGRQYGHFGSSKPIIFSPNGKRIAYAARREGQCFVVVDGIERKARNDEEIADITFSPDSKQLAYRVSIGNKFRIVVGEAEGKEYELGHPGPGGLGGQLPRRFPVFSPDSKHIAYPAHQDGKEFMVLDGLEGKRYAITRIPWFSPNSKRLAYWAVHRNDEFRKESMVVDGNEGRQYDGVNPDYIAFSPDSKHFAYEAHREGKAVIVTDRKEGKEYDYVLLPMHRLLASFSPNSRLLVYLAQRSRKPAYFMVVKDLDPKKEGAEEREGKEYDDVFRLRFSADSRHLIYLAKQKGKWFVVTDGLEGKHHDLISNCFFSPNSRRTLYHVARGYKRVPVPGSGLCGDAPAKPEAPEEQTKEFLVVDGNKWKEYDHVGAPSFSPNSRRVAFVAYSKGKQLVVVDGKEGRHYDEVLVTWEKTADFLSYPYNPYGMANWQWQHFSPDSRHVAYVAKCNGKWRIVVDGVEASSYDHFIEPPRIPTKLVFDSPRSLHAIGVRDGKMFRVEVEIVSR